MSDSDKDTITRLVTELKLAVLQGAIEEVLSQVDQECVTQSILHEALKKANRLNAIK